MLIDNASQPLILTTEGETVHDLGSWAQANKVRRSTEPSSSAEAVSNEREGLFSEECSEEHLGRWH